MNRNRMKLIGTVLELSQDKIKGTTLLRKANMPSGRMSGLLQNLTANGLMVKIEKHWVITDKGRIYLEKYKQFNDVAESYGLEL